MDDFDVIVAGAGGMGSAALAHCALRGARAVALEQFTPAHALGSSSGKSRIVRRAYFEDARYVPLLNRAYELWRELEAFRRTPLLHFCGVLSVGDESARVVAGARAASERCGVPVEMWTSGEIARRYPALRPRPNEAGVFEPGAGFVVPEEAVEAHLQLARSHGAQVRYSCAVDTWEADEQGVRVRLSGGEAIRARTLILTLGPWFKPVLESLGVPIRIQRNVQLWFSPRTGEFGPDRLPAFLLQRADLPAICYGFPDTGNGVKAALHRFGSDVAAAADVDREVHAEDVRPVADALESWIPGAAGPVSDAKVCMYTLTPDEHFVVDLHPQHPNVVVCGGFSGHGFKFAPVVGEIAAALALDGGTPHETGFIALRRFAP